MARKRAAQETTEAPEAPATAPANTVSKADAVRAALAEGIDSPDDGIEFVKKRFGIEMEKPTWSSYKSAEKARQAKAASGDRPRRGRPPITPSAAPAAPKTSSTSSTATAGGVADSLKAVKTLVDRLGADEVIKIAEIFRQ